MKLSSSFALVRIPGNHSSSISIFQMQEDSNAELFEPFNTAVANKRFLCSAWNDARKCTVWDQHVGDFQSEVLESLDLDFHFRNIPFESTSESEHQFAIEGALDALSKSDITKVVIARQKHKTFKSNTQSILHVFNNLCLNYPQAFVYVCSSKKWGTWMGASPETLLKYDGEQVEVMSLAGTLFNEGENWSDKERAEQTVTSQFIEDCLEWDAGQKVLIEELKQGNLRHLKSVYRKPWRFENISLLIERLSPTPAVAGIPRENAVAFIAKNEAFARDLYAGYLGIQEGENLDLFVNLRCTELRKDALRLIAGGGINLGSNPFREWEETERKMSVIEGCLS